MVIIEIDIEEEIKKLQLELKMVLDRANINVNRIKGALAFLKNLDERNKKTAETEDTKLENKRLE